MTREAGLPARPATPRSSAGSVPRDAAEIVVRVPLEGAPSIEVVAETLEDELRAQLWVTRARQRILAEIDEALGTAG